MYRQVIDSPHWNSVVKMAVSGFFEGAAPSNCVTNSWRCSNTYWYISSVTATFKYREHEHVPNENLFHIFWRLCIRWTAHLCQLCQTFCSCGWGTGRVRCLLLSTNVVFWKRELNYTSTNPFSPFCARVPPSMPAALVFFSSSFCRFRANNFSTFRTEACGGQGREADDRRTKKNGKAHEKPKSRNLERARRLLVSDVPPSWSSAAK